MGAPALTEMAIDPLNVCGTAGPVGQAIATILFKPKPAPPKQLNDAYLVILCAIHRDSGLRGDPEGMAIVLARVAFLWWYCGTAVNKHIRQEAEDQKARYQEAKSAGQTDRPEQPAVPAAG